MSGSRIAGAGSGAPEIIAAVESAAAGSTAYLDRSAAGAGLIPGVRTVHEFGFNPAVTNTEVVVWAAAVPYTGFLTAASALRIRVGGDAADDTAGAGARSVHLEGLLAGVEVSTDSPLATAGASASGATSQTFDRFRVGWVIDDGTYSDGTTGSNVGPILIETTAGVLVGAIGAQRGQTQIGVYTIPAGYTGYLMRVYSEVSGSSSQQATIRMWQRQNYTTVVAPVSAKRIVEQWPEVVIVDEELSGHISFPALTDVWMTAQKVVGGSAVGVEASFKIELRAD